MTDVVELEENELETLKAQATKMGISFHPNIGLETIKKRLKAKQEPTIETVKTVETVSKSAPVITKREILNQRKNNALRSIRVQVTCMDPSRKAYQGQIFSVGNRLVGMVKKFVQFEVPFHVPSIILEQIKNAQYRHSYKIRDARGNDIPQSKLVPAFSVVELPELTDAELKDLQQRQAVAAGTRDTL